MKMANNTGFSAIVVFGIIVIIFLAECNADQITSKSSGPNPGNQRKVKKTKCLQYGHSCWGGHGKRTQQAPLAEEWSRFIHPNYKRSSLPELAYVLNRPPLEIANEIAMMRQASLPANYDETNERRNPLNFDNGEEQGLKDVVYLTEPIADPENNLMQILGDNEAFEK